MKKLSLNDLQEIALLINEKLGELITIEDLLKTREYCTLDEDLSNIQKRITYFFDLESKVINTYKNIKKEG